MSESVKEEYIDNIVGSFYDVYKGEASSPNENNENNEKSNPLSRVLCLSETTSDLDLDTIDSDLKWLRFPKGIPDPVETDFSDLTIHLQSHPSPNKRFNENTQEKSDNERPMTETTKSKCCKCSKIFSSDFYLKRHVQSTHVPRTCDLCGKLYSSKYHLERHIRSIHHNDEKSEHLQSQPSSNKGFSDKTRETIAKVKPLTETSKNNCQNPQENRNKCDICDRIFSSNFHLKMHVQKFHPSRSCDQCGKVFTRKCNLERHIRYIHFGVFEKSDPCPYCGKILKNKSSLLPHIKYVHQGIKHICKICGAVLSDLPHHMRHKH